MKKQLKSITAQWHAAREIAKTAHDGKTDKAGQTYFGHVSRVADVFGTTTWGVMALLHDVVEDTDWTFDQLREHGFNDLVVDAVDALTHRNGEEYMDYIERCACNMYAIHVKIADLEDNMDIRRLTEITDEDVARLRKYHQAYLYLKSKTR